MEPKKIRQKTGIAGTASGCHLKVPTSRLPNPSSAWRGLYDWPVVIRWEPEGLNVEARKNWGFPIC